MSLGAAIHEWLSDNLSVGERVYPLMLPQGAALPAVTYQTISDNFQPNHSTAQGHPTHTGSLFRFTRIQFNCYGATYDDAEALRDELLQVAAGYRGYWGEHWIEAVLPDIALDDFEPGPNHWRWLQDLIVHHKGGDANGS